MTGATSCTAHGRDNGGGGGALFVLTQAVAQIEQEQNAAASAGSHKLAKDPPISSLLAKVPESVCPGTAAAMPMPMRNTFSSASQPRIVSSDRLEETVSYSMAENSTKSPPIGGGGGGTVAPRAAPFPVFSSNPYGGFPVHEYSASAIQMAKIADLRHMISCLDLSELKIIPVPRPGEAISTVEDNDVLSGRGGETNHHAGNIAFRAMVKACQHAYIEAKRRDKPYIAQRIVLMIRKMGGRFLKRDRETNTWRDVGNGKAREKTSQALREGAPELRVDGKDQDSIPVKKIKKKKSPSMPSCDHRPDDHKPRYSAPKVFETSSTHAVYPAMVGCCDSSGVPFHQNESQPHPKKRRVSNFDLAGTAVSSTTMLTSLPSSHQPGNMSPKAQQQQQTPQQQPSPFAATVSADDEEGSHQSCQQHSSPSPPCNMSIKGPRIKLLKKRLESDGNSV